MKKPILTIIGIGILVLMFCTLIPSNSTVNTLSARGRPPSGDCSILSPSNGATVSGVVTITVSASATPTIFIDGAEVATGFSYDWDTTGAADGDHSIKASISKKTKQQITVTVDNGGTPPPPPPPEGNKFALVIGISNYEGTANDLTYCDDDARDWANYLSDEGYSVNLLIDAQAKANDILAAFEALATAEEAGDSVVITYSGHGYYERSIRDSCLVSQDLYLIPSQMIEDITDTFDSTSVFSFWDCCNAGKFADLTNNGWVNAVGSTTRSYTYDGDSSMQNGIYTYYAMEAIGLGYITAEDIANYARDMFNAATPGKATTYDQFSGELDI